MDTNVKKEKCEFCGDMVPDYNTIYLTFNNKRTCTCLKCYNRRISEYLETDFEHVEFDPIILKDAHNTNHQFYFNVQLLHDYESVIIEAFEIKEGHKGGYEFSIIGDNQDEIFELFGKLFERIRRALNRKHIDWDNSTNSWQISEDNVVRAKIDCDLESNDKGYHLPLIVIDGKEIKWNEFGKMLMTFEGFNLKIEIFDRSDEVS